MALTREKKQEVIQKIKDKIEKQKAIVFVAIAGIGAKDLFDFREKLKKEECNLTVAKKTLVNIAFKEKKIDFNKEKLEGQPALIFGFGDALSPAKIAYRFSQTNENLKILGGFFENKFIEKEEVVKLAKMPSRAELLSRLVSNLSAPISNFANVLQGNIKGLLVVLSKLKT